MKPLPTNPQRYTPMDEQRFATVTTMAFFCADVTYQFMVDSCNMLLRDRKDLKHDVRYRYNNFIRAMDAARKAAVKVGNDVMGLSEEKIDFFFEDAEYIKQIMTLVYDKTKNGKNGNDTKIINFLKDL